MRCRTGRGSAEEGRRRHRADLDRCHVPKRGARPRDQDQRASSVTEAGDTSSKRRRAADEVSRKPQIRQEVYKGPPGRESHTEASE